MGRNVNVLITGAGGFIGSHMASFLKSKGYTVIGLDINFPEIRHERWLVCDKKYRTDVRNFEDLEFVFELENIDWVLHFASDMGGVGYFSTHDYYPYLNNMQMDINILKICEQYKIKRLFYSSSACIYPIHKQQDTSNPFIASEDEIYPANSDQMYGWEKLMMTRLCERSPIDARVGIFHTIYGPGQEWEGERAKFPPSIARKVIESKKTGKPIQIWGDGSQLRTFCYIDDAVEKIYRILTMPYYGPVNVASSELVSVMDTAELLCEIVDVPKKFIHENSKPSGVLARGANNTKFEKIYKYKNKYSLREGFTQVVDWLKKSNK